jgi:hypothetical protein
MDVRVILLLSIENYRSCKRRTVEMLDVQGRAPLWRQRELEKKKIRQCVGNSPTGKLPFLSVARLNSYPL